MKGAPWGTSLWSLTVPIQVTKCHKMSQNVTKCHKMSQTSNPDRHSLTHWLIDSLTHWPYLPHSPNGMRMDEKMKTCQKFPYRNISKQSKYVGPMGLLKFNSEWATEHVQWLYSAFVDFLLVHLTMTAPVEPAQWNWTRLTMTCRTST